MTTLIGHPTYTKRSGYSFEHGRWVYRCGEIHCYYSTVVSGPTPESGTEHNCPVGNGTTRVSWSVYGPSLLEKTWAELDTVTAKLMEGERSEENIGYARGLAFTLSLFMMPHFTTPADISREAGKRYKMKVVDPEYCTPGLAARRYEAPPGDHKLDRGGAQRASVVNKPKPAHPTLTAEQIQSIKNARGVIDDKDLAAMYKCTVQFIQGL